MSSCFLKGDVALWWSAGGAGIHVKSVPLMPSGAPVCRSKPCPVIIEAAVRTVAGGIQSPVPGLMVRVNPRAKGDNQFVLMFQRRKRLAPDLPIRGWRFGLDWPIKCAVSVWVRVPCFCSGIDLGAVSCGNICQGERLIVETTAVDAT